MSGSRRLVVYTAITGDYDQPLPQPADPDADHVLFSDRDRPVPAPWQCRRLDGQLADPHLASRHPKILPHRYFPDHDVSLWIDGNIFLKQAVSAQVDTLLHDAPLAAYPHEHAGDPGAEAIEIVKLGKGDASAVARALTALWTPDLDLPLGGLPTGTVLLRRHNQPAVVAAMEDWWRCVRDLFFRDQVSLAVILARAGIPWRALPGETAYDNDLFGARPHKRPRPEPVSPARSDFFRLQQFSDAFRPAHGAWAAAMTGLLNQIAEPAPIRSVLDLGCGVGSLLALLAPDCSAIGVEGPWLADVPLRVPGDRIIRHDLLAAPLDLGRRFDLAVCVDVGQYLPASMAPVLVETLCRHANRVLFAAGIPEQLTDGLAHDLHPSDWGRLFADHGYVAEDLRPRIWNQAALPLSLRQAAILYHRRPDADPAPVLDMMHPEVHHRQIARLARHAAAIGPQAEAARQLTARIRQLGGQATVTLTSDGLRIAAPRS